ncbi:hypothetical protein JKG47_03600 [Acidithiobacillus sp. MC6.1]|nr:hypothetical protein [Acidithiobacillus sp. MC6.1]
MRIHQKLKCVALACALYAGSVGLAQAASVDQVSGNAALMPTLNRQYVHSRHAGTMPYWGPCYRCKMLPVQTASPQCAANTPPEVLAEWTNSGTSSCGSQETDTFEATTQCLTNGEESIEFTETSSDPGATVSQKSYQLSADYTLMNGLANVTGTGPVGQCSGSTGAQTDFTCGFGQNSCGNNFDWYPEITVDGTEGSGSFNGTITFTNYLSPTQEQSASFDVQFSNYITTKERICKQYPPLSSECTSTQDTAAVVNSGLPVYQWPCNTQENGWQAGFYCNGYFLQSNWIFGSADASTEPPESAYSVMETEYENPTGTPQNGKLYIETDGAGWVWINGVQVAYVNSNGGSSTDIQEFNASLPAGNDKIVFMVQNIPNCSFTNQSTCTPKPAAGILTLLEGSNNMLAVNSNEAAWYLIGSPPATPYPTPQSLMPSGWTPVNCATQTC